MACAGGGLRGCGCWHQIKATHTAELHLPWWTMAFSLACIGVFLYMAGQQAHPYCFNILSWLE